MTTDLVPSLKAGVIGYPVAHSRSPQIHGYWLKLHEIDGSYDARAVEPENLEPLIGSLANDGYQGINVTLPHKEAVLPMMDHLEGFAQRAGAVNTIVVRDDGSLEGRNTDGFGFLENIRAKVKQWDAKSGPVAIIGAGGASRAIITALLDAGAPEIRLTNRSFDKAEALAETISLADGRPAPVIVRPFEDRAATLTDAALVVNCTSLGMDGKPALDLDLTTLPPSAVVTDIVYTPLMTPLLKEAKMRGNAVVDGLGMLLHQARPGFAAWFGTMPKVTPMLRAMIENDVMKG